MSRKRIIKFACVFVLICGVAIGAFFVGKFSASNTNPTTFYADIVSLNENVFVVQGLEINDINSRGQFKFTIDEKTIFEWHNTVIQIDDLQVGDTISVTYSSDVAESDPAGIKNIKKIILLDDEK